MLAPQELIVSLVILTIGAFAMPKHASCPASRGWMGGGIRPNGSFSCLHNAQVESDAPADGELRGWLFCGHNEQPIVTTERAFRCAPMHTQED